MTFSSIYEYLEYLSYQILSSSQVQIDKKVYIQSLDIIQVFSTELGKSFFIDDEKQILILDNCILSKDLIEEQTETEFSIEESSEMLINDIFSSQEKKEVSSSKIKKEKPHFLSTTQFKTKKEILKPTAKFPELMPTSPTLDDVNSLFDLSQDPEETEIF